MSSWQSISFLLIFFFLLLLFLYLGNKISQWQTANKAQPKSFGYQILEGAVFTLMGLIVAFTFSNANQKLDMRRGLIIDEANAIGTAYLRLDLLPADAQLTLKNDFKEYLSARIATYEVLPNLSKAYQQITKANELQNKIWNLATNSCKENNDRAICMLVLPALNNMFDIANKRIVITKLHPPLIIFYLLIGIALLSSFLAGYDIKQSERKRSIIFVVPYAAIVAITVYIIIDMEYPRLGLIRIDSFDAALLEVSALMQK